MNVCESHLTSQDTLFETLSTRFLAQNANYLLHAFHISALQMYTAMQNMMVIYRYVNFLNYTQIFYFTFHLLIISLKKL